MEENITFQMPAEWSAHAGTIMTWPTADRILQAYSHSDIEATWTELSTIAKTISQFEPVHVFVRDPKGYTPPTSTHAAPLASGFASAQNLLAGQPNVQLYVTPNVESMWARDNGAIFVRTRNGQVLSNTWEANDLPGHGFSNRNTSSPTAGLLLGFQQWGRSYPPGPDAYLAFTSCQALELPAIQGPWISEGGSIETDGAGTLLTTESSILNPNRNPGLSRNRLEGYFLDFLGVKKTIWLKGQRGRDNTDGHVDCLARFTEETGVVLLSREHGQQGKEGCDHAARLLRESADALGKKLSVITIEEPDASEVLGKYDMIEGAPCLSYVNFYIVNGAVIMPAFGDESRDAEAKRIVQDCFPTRAVVQIALRQLALQGGGIHCATKQFIA